MQRLFWLAACAAVLAGGQASRPSAPSKPAAPFAASKSALDKATLEAYVRHLYLWGPQVKVFIGQPQPSRRLPGFFEVSVQAWAGAATHQEVLYVSSDGFKILKAVVFDVRQHPFQDEISKLKIGGDPSFGQPGAPVTVVLFSDFQCGFCREEALTLRKNLLTTFPNQVQVYFKDFPLESIHPWAKMAAIAGRCIFRQRASAFWEYHDWIYEHQSEITPENLRAKIMEFARSRETTIDALQLRHCLDNRATEAEVDRLLAEGKALQINSTPTLFVNGRRLVGHMPWDNLRQIIEYEIGYQKAAGNAEQHCCEVKIPTPLKD